MSAKYSFDEMPFIAYIEETGGDLMPLVAGFCDWVDASIELRKTMVALNKADGALSVGAIYCRRTNTILDTVGISDPDLAHIADVIRNLLDIPVVQNSDIVPVARGDHDGQV